jgi:bacillithiol biosynthesis cysteine-adding enzyme BshC
MMIHPMEFDCLAPNELPRVSRLYSAYLDGAKKLSEFYAYPPTLAAIVRAARELKRGKYYSREMRSTVADILADQNRGFAVGPLPVSVERNLASLREGAVAVVTGQQAGLFGGPAYTFYKALSVLRVVGELHQRGIEAVPVFWIASEDHDLAEVNHCDWLTRSGLRRLAWASPLNGTQARSVGRIKLGDAVTTLVREATDGLEGPFYDEVAEALEAAYQPDQTFGSAFARLLARIFANYGLILLDPLDERLHRLAAPVLKRVPDEQNALTVELLARDKHLEQAGYHSQVKVTERTTLLFATVDGQRVAIRRRNGHFLIGEKELTAAELVAAIGREPESFSPNALFRPVVQDNLLPTVAYVAGPSEMAYFAQSNVVYRHGLGHMPVVVPRASFTLIEPSIERLLERYDIEIQDVFRGRQHLRGLLERQSLPRGLDARFTQGESELRKILAGMRKPVTKLDATLGGALDTADRKILYQFGKLRAKSGRAVDLRTGIITAHERTLREALYPNNDLQDRSLSLLPFLARHGHDLLDWLARHSGIGCPAHQVVRL